MKRLKPETIRQIELVLFGNPSKAGIAEVRIERGEVAVVETSRRLIGKAEPDAKAQGNR